MFTESQKKVLKRAARIIANRVKEAEGINYMQSPEHVRDYLQCQLISEEKEKFLAIWLDNRHGVIAIETLFTGTVDGAAVYPREVMKKALHHNAAAVILAHNHPSGVCEPSDADIAITKKLKKALDYIDIHVLDHFIVGNTITSMAERGLV